VVFQTDYDKIELKNQLGHGFSNVVVITSLENFIKLTSQDFPILGPAQSEFLTTPMVRVLLLSHCV